MIDLLESKLDVVPKAIEFLWMKTNRIEDFITRFHKDHECGTSQPMESIVL